MFYAKAEVLGKHALQINMQHTLVWKGAKHGVFTNASWGEVESSVKKDGRISYNLQNYFYNSEEFEPCRHQFVLVVSMF